MANLQEFLSRLPDSPALVETRGMLLSGRGFVLGELPDFIVCSNSRDLAFISGQPSAELIDSIISDGKSGLEILAVRQNQAYVSGILTAWNCSRAIIHSLSEKSEKSENKSGEQESGVPIRFVNKDELVQLVSVHLELYDELVEVIDRSKIAAVFAEGRPVSFCYSTYHTETLWDVSIETLPDYQRRGYGEACASFMIQYMRSKGLQPVWGAVEGNEGSLKLAEKLGFVPADELFLFSRRR